MPANTDNIDESKKSRREFIFFGFKSDAQSMILTLQSLAIIALFAWCISLSNSTRRDAKESIEEANARADRQVQMVLQILRPDIIQIQNQVNQANSKIDTAAKAIQQTTKKLKEK